MDVKNVGKWCREFTAGRTEIHEEQTATSELLNASRRRRRRAGMTWAV